ncbi:MAG: class I SAM-dependent methyltransferase [Chthoniobacterales bacterium]|nr:class I SAM-dependent methyltransferase [Chthoniobacterales bacterium]
MPAFFAVNFDRVAPHYRRLERIVFDEQLQAARCAFVRQIPAANRALVVGEGDARFLAELRRAQPELQVDCLDASARMLALAQKRAGQNRVRFLHADICEAAFPPHRYDLVVTHFFLDCFAAETLREVVTKLSGAATDNAIWLVADFSLPPNGWRRWWARLLIGTMYFFFRFVAGIEARRLIDYAPLMRENGFCLTNEKISAHGLIRSQCWRCGQITNATLVSS